MRDHQCANTHCIAFADKFKEIVEGKGDKAMVLAANDDPETLLQCIDDLVAAGVDGIVMESPNATAPVEALREAAEKGIVISAADVLLDIEESEGVLVSQTVSDNYGAGVLCANDLIERLDGKEGTVCHIIYEENEAVTTRVKGFLDTIEKEENIKVLEGTQPTPVTQEAEMAVAESWASKYDEITAVFGGGGPIAIAFMRGLEAAGVKCSPDGGTYIYGVDGSQDEYACILDGDYTGTARQQPDELARIATEDVYTVLGGGEIGHDWLGSTQTALGCIIAVEVWKWSGYVMTVFLAGLQGISREYYESAKIDGAGSFQAFWFITLPLLIPSFTVNVTMCVIGGFKVFDQVFVMTNGGPGFATQVLNTMIYQAFSEGRLAKSAAMGIVLFVFISIISVSLSGILHRKEENMT